MLGQRAGQLSPLLRCAWDGGDLSAAWTRSSTPPTRTSASSPTSPKASSPNTLPASNRTTALPTAVSGPACAAANPCPRAAAYPRTSSPRWPASSATPWTGRKAKPAILFRRTPEARELWMDRYPALSEGRQDVYGAATSRAEAQVLRLSALYAALDRRPWSKPPISTPPWPYGTTARPALVSSSTTLPSIPRRAVSAKPSPPPPGAEQGPNRWTLSWPSQQRTHRACAATAMYSGRHQLPPPAWPRTPLHHLDPPRRRQPCRPRDLTRITRFSRTFRREKVDPFGG